MKAGSDLDSKQRSMTARMLNWAVAIREINYSQLKARLMAGSDLYLYGIS